jgi:hypothetical protein
MSKRLADGSTSVADFGDRAIRLPVSNALAETAA